MTLHLGNVPANSTLYIPFASYGKTNGESITLTGLAVTDIEIYKNGSTTQRASDAGYTLLDTDGIDFDGLTGIHGFSIDLSDNTDASFYAVGSFYWVVVSSVTIDSQTVNFIAATFRIVAAEAIAGKPKVDVDAWLGAAAATPTVAGVPEVDLTHVAGSTTDVSTIPASVAAILVDTGTTLDGNLSAVKAKTDNLPSDPADASDVAAAFATVNATLGTPAGASLAADIAGVQSDTNDIQTRLPAALTAGGNMKSDALAISGSTGAADKMEALARTIVEGVCDTGGTTTAIVASSLTPASTVNDQFNGLLLKFADNTSTAALRGQGTRITDFVHATQTFTVDALTTAPSSGDVFTVS